MKKSIKLIISILFIISLLSFIIGILILYKAPDSQTLKREKFKEYIEKMDCSLIDVEKQFEGVNYYYITDKKTCPLTIGYISFVNDETKDAFYTTAINDMFSDKKVNNGKEVEFKNYLEQSVTGKEYKSITVKGNTIMYLSTNKKNKELAIDVLTDLGYHYEPEWKALKLIYLSILITVIVLMVSWWKINVKLGRKGWVSLIPIYNIICLTKDIFGSVFYSLLLLIPAVNVLFIIMLLYKLGKKFNKPDGYCLGLISLITLFVPFLAFDKSKMIKN